MKRYKSILKAKLRDWLFQDYKWITRAKVQAELSSILWEYRHHDNIPKRKLIELTHIIK
jgi:hypothetical protein